MKFAVITHVIHKKENHKLLAYAPYVLEMKRWFKNIDEVKVVAPLDEHQSSEIAIAYQAKQLELENVPQFSLISIIAIFKTVFKLPFICCKIIEAMLWADHIHLRCPGNMGLLGSFIQVFFPSKPKTVKYAGNWDPASKQPWSYKLQKWIISNTLLSKNIKVLVYGSWSNQTKNVVPFFTASFSESEVQNVEKDFTSELKFLFVGSLVEGKQPLCAIRLVEELKNKGRIVSLKIFGEGPLRPDLENYIQTKNLSTYITICGGVSLDQLKNEYKRSHFSILPSKSEGWPKAIAEAMFFGCIPIATKVSCVPWMLDAGNRGIFLSGNLKEDVINVLKELGNKEELYKKSEKSKCWSQNYTIEYFEQEIAKLL